MRTTLMAVVACAGLVLAAVPVRAHHAFAAEFDQNKPIKVQGSVTKWELTNPHSWIHVQGEDSFRRPKVYSVEWASVSRLERDGITKRTLREGDWVRIWASPNRNPNDNRIRLKRIERRGDKWSWGQNRGETR